MKRNQKSTRMTLCLEPLEDRCLLSTGYTLVDLGGLPGLSYKQSSAVSMNEAGDIVGNSYTAGPTGPSRHPVVWHRDASGAFRITDLGLLVGPGTQANGQAYDINNRGEVIGWTATDVGSYTFLVRPEDTDGVGGPDRWYRDTNGDGFNDLMINLTALNGGAAVSRDAINDQGQIIGQYMLNQFDGSGSLVTNSSVGGQDINNNGQIVGDYYNNTTGYSVQNSLWRVDAAGTIVSGPMSLGMSDARGINSSGSAVAGGWAGQVWQRGTVTNLGTLGGASGSTLAWAVNDSVQVVGRSNLKNNDTQAFVWQGGTMTNLNKYLPRNSGWKLSSASSINNAGWIAGDGRVSVGKGTAEFRGFLMISTNNLTAAAQANRSAADISLSPQQVQPILSVALARWRATGADTSLLGAIDIRIADLGGTTLGLASGNTIWLDDNAAGWGWFVDPTPGDDSEFTTPGDQGEQHRMDLLTVLEHEIGHLLGHDHEEDGVMAETLSAGTRLTLHGVDVQESWWLAGLPDTNKKRDVFGWWL